MGSGWRFHGLIRSELHTVRYKPLKGETYIPLPKELAVKTAIITMKKIRITVVFCGVFSEH